MPAPLDTYFPIAIGTRNDCHIAIRPNEPLHEIDMVLHDGQHTCIVVKMHPLEVDALILALQSQLNDLTGKLREIDMVIHDGQHTCIVVKMHPLEVDALILALQSELNALTGKVRVI